MDANGRNDIVETGERFDFLTRYFLRQLASARRKPHANLSVPYNVAVMEVIFVALGAPSVGIVSFLALATMKWWSHSRVGELFADSKYAVVLIFLILCLAAGFWWLPRKFRQYKNNQEACLAFNSERDRRIAETQRKVFVYFFGAVLPFLGLMLGFLVDRL